MRIEPQADGGWRIALAGAHTSATTARLTPAQVSDIQSALQRSLAPDPLAMLRADERATVLREARAGQALSAIWTPALAQRLGQLRAQGQVLMAVEAEGAAAQLPWELLSDTAGVALASTRSQVLRLSAAGASTPRQYRQLHVQIVAWTDDALVTAVGEHIRSVCDQECIEYNQVGSDDVLIDPASDDAFRLVFLAAHGEALAQLGWAADGRAASTTALSLPTAELVVLLVCDGDHQLPARILASGARVCVAPAGRVGAQAARTFSGVLINRLHAGADAVTAVGAAREAVRSLAHAAPDMRWHRWRVHTGSLAPGAWGAVATRSAAEQAAHERGGGFFGLEHLILHPPPDFDAPLRYACVQSAALVARHLALFEPPERSIEVTPTPRMQAGTGLAVATRQLIDALVGRLGGAPVVGGTTMGRADDVQPPAPALMVLGGPEDGRIIQPAVGDAIGRYSARPRAEHLLYDAHGAWDPKLSRCHLRWWGGAVEAVASLWVDGVQISPGERGEVRVGTVVQLGGATRLVGWAP